MSNKINIIDLFAGPGGLGEGFSAFENTKGQSPFKIRMSVEKEASAHQTLQLRAFFRQFKKGNASNDYYDYIRNPRLVSKKELFTWHKDKFENAKKETLEKPRTLGDKTDDEYIFNQIRKLKREHKGETFIVIGGPPCQAYSLAGRSRNAGIKDYTTDTDHRVVLYKEYLKVLDEVEPDVFVMENVKGILSAEAKGKKIFPQILRDLKNPKKATGKKSGPDYEIYSLVKEYDNYTESEGPVYNDITSYTIKSEEYGIPQNRHRVILLGVKKNIDHHPLILDKSEQPVSIESIINCLPKLRSGLSKGIDSYNSWLYEIQKSGYSLINRLPSQLEMAKLIKKTLKNIPEDLSRGGPFVKSINMGFIQGFRGKLKDWLHDPRLGGFPNHETRGHITSDLKRYLWASIYTELNIDEKHPSPKAKNFPAFLAPKHKNWKSGSHSDRFRVQVRNRPATTITSHISKDGHYFIHYDPTQCRSLTVREAARIQTFPDNYFFEGTRTQQYVQVGNAVPPFLAKQIAEIVYQILDK